MKVYRRVEGAVQTAEVPDGAECLEVGARPADYDAPRIVAINWKDRTYQREGCEPAPFPERWYRVDTLEWKQDS